MSIKFHPHPQDPFLRSWLNGGPVDRSGRFFAVVHYDGRFYCVTCIHPAIGVGHREESVDSVFADEVPSEGVECEHCGERHSFTGGRQS